MTILSGILKVEMISIHQHSTKSITNELMIGLCNPVINKLKSPLFTASIKYSAHHHNVWKVADYNVSAASLLCEQPGG